MENYFSYAVSSLLVVSAVLLGILIPGGPIENRNFSHISPVVLLIFNTFLTILGIGSMLLAYFSLTSYEISFIAAAICGISYFTVYVLDLGKIFPVSPDKMPRALLIIEVVGLLLAIPLTLLSLVSIFLLKNDATGFEISSSIVILALVLMIAPGLAIVIFATMSAMRKTPNKTNLSDAKKPR